MSVYGPGDWRKLVADMSRLGRIWADVSDLGKDAVARVIIVDALFAPLVIVARPYPQGGLELGVEVYARYEGHFISVRVPYHPDFAAANIDKAAERIVRAVQIIIEP